MFSLSPLLIIILALLLVQNDYVFSLSRQGLFSLYRRELRGKSKSILRQASNDFDRNKKDNNSNSKKSTKFDRIVDDFIGKKYGAGEAFYGKRTSGLSEEEYSMMQEASSPKSSFEGKPLRENAILLVGDVHVGMASWVAFELYEKGFNIRLACLESDKTNCINAYGLPGNNVDIVDIDLSSRDIEQQLSTAVQGVQAVIFCGNFEPKLPLQIPFLTPGLKGCEVQNELAMQIIDLIGKAEKAKVSSVKKVMTISRYIPATLISSKGNDLESASNSMYAKFRSLHKDLESSIRKLGAETSIDVTIVRAPPSVIVTRGQSKYNVDLFPDDDLDDSTSPSNLGKIGVLDFAEVVAQALIADLPGETIFTASEVPTAGMSASLDDEDIISNEPLTRLVENPSRVQRDAYYSILKMDDSEMSASYMLRPAQLYKDQIEEDKMLDAFWREKFQNLKRL